MFMKTNYVISSEGVVASPPVENQCTEIKSLIKILCFCVDAKLAPKNNEGISYDVDENKGKCF